MQQIKRFFGWVALVLLLGALLDKIGLFHAASSITSTMTFGAALILGLVAGSSSCLAVSGGLMLSTITAYEKTHAGSSAKKNMRPVVLFVFGRLISYTVLGGMIGLLGTAFQFSSTITGLITLFAAVYMFAMGLEMLEVSPMWLKCRMPRMPKWLTNKILDAEGNPNAFAPLLLGAATFFLPCGFTQSLQVYALTTGSAMTSASVLGAFALGTVPALLAIGFASSMFQGNKRMYFIRFAGAMVIVLGFYNAQNGLTLMGVSTSFANTTQPAGYRVVNADTQARAPEATDGVQNVKLSLTEQAPFYAPSDTITVQAGKPVRLEIDGQGYGCRSMFQIPGLNVSMLLNKEANIAEFTPSKPGRYVFSCGMGMYRGTLIVQS